MRIPMTMWESKTFIRQSEELMSAEEDDLSQKEKAELKAVIKSIRDENRKTNQ
jgi:hypothetical protein